LHSAAFFHFHDQLNTRRKNHRYAFWDFAFVFSALEFLFLRTVRAATGGDSATNAANSL
jgi:hypothetical protein